MKLKTFIPSLLVIALSACSQNSFVINNKVFCFDTYIETNLYEGDKKDSEKLEEFFTYFDKVSDNYQARNITNVYSINHTNDNVEIDKELYDLLKTSFEVNKEGAKYFNPLCGSLAKKWKESLAKGEVLDEATVQGELTKMNSSSLVFKDNNVVQRTGEAEIDLGGIVKGYVLDKSLEYLKNKNITSYILNAGSSSILLGEKKSKDGLFSVGLNDVPNAYIKVKNAFVSTSSKSVQGVKIGDLTYSHIINPITGSALNENDAVIVITDKGYLGDALSTSMMMNTVDEIKTIEQEQNVKTIVIKNNKVIYSHKDIEVLYR